MAHRPLPRTVTGEEVGAAEMNLAAQADRLQGRSGGWGFLVGRRLWRTYAVARSLWLASQRLR